MADFSTHTPFTSSIVQGSGIGPTLWLIMESDLHPLSDANVIFKYANDTNLLVPEHTDCTLAEEFSHIERWAFYAYHLPFLQILPTVALLSSSRLTTRIPQTEHIRFFYFSVFLFYAF